MLHYEDALFPKGLGIAKEIELFFNCKERFTFNLD